MKRLGSLHGGALALLLAVLCGASPLYAQSAAARLKGAVKSADGAPMAGVTVSARGEGKTMVTTVFTDEKGVYVFPPMEAGSYSLWAQAEGFQTARTNVSLKTGGVQQAAALELKPLKNFERQLTGVEWMNSFPGGTPEEKRDKQIFASNCSGCHANNFALQNRFDADGWSKIITVMSKDSEAVTMRPGATGAPVMNAYKDEIVKFLTRVRGPAPPDYQLKTLPRPAGDAARVVITEYDIPRASAPPEVFAHTGSDWMEGTPSRWEGRAAHDVAVGRGGNLFFSDDRAPDRTIFELDPRTGEVKLFKFPAKNGGVAATHGLNSDPSGNLWADDEDNGDLLMFDPTTEQFKDFQRPADIPRAGGTLAADANGIIWSTSPDGALRLDPKTGKYEFYRLVTPGKGTYGMAVDRYGNAWFTSPGSDRVDVVDGKTREVSEIVFPPLGPETGMQITPQDKENYATLKANQNSATPLHQCPRRIGADPNGDVVWVALFCSDKIASMDIHTHQIKTYDMPHKYSRPYGLVVDRNHNVWIDMLNTDMVAKFDPSTGKFTDYHMPSRGTDIRDLVVKYVGNQPEVWLAYNRTNKIARMQFRKASDMK